MTTHVKTMETKNKCNASFNLSVISAKLQGVISSENSFLGGVNFFLDFLSILAISNQIPVFLGWEGGVLVLYKRMSFLGKFRVTTWFLENRTVTPPSPSPSCLLWRNKMLVSVRQVVKTTL